MIIEFPDCKFRISGESVDWQIQYPRKRKDSETWEGRYFFPNLENAIAKAYELSLRESGNTVDVRALPGECRKVKESLLRAVRRALADREGRGAA